LAVFRDFSLPPKFRKPFSGAPALFSISLTRSLLLSHPTLRLRGRLSITSEADEQPNSKPVWGREAENVTGEARRVLWAAGSGGFREGWAVGACGAGQSSWRVSRWGGKVFDVWSGIVGQRDGAEWKKAKALGGGAGVAAFALSCDTLRDHP
jgi:hypothetical protein